MWLKLQSSQQMSGHAVGLTPEPCVQVLFKLQDKSINEQKKAVKLEDIKFHQCMRLDRRADTQSCVQVLFKSQGKSINEQKKAVELEDIKFHQCVRLTRFETDRTISFIPPDGAFDLMVRPCFAASCALLIG